jgi:hypothetical protein
MISPCIIEIIINIFHFIITCIAYHCWLCDAHCRTRIWTISAVVRLSIISCVWSLFRFPLFILILIWLPYSLLNHIYRTRAIRDTIRLRKEKGQRARMIKITSFNSSFLFGYTPIKLRIKSMFWKKDRCVCWLLILN